MILHGQENKIRMENEIKILTGNNCYTTLLVNGKEHIVPTRELDGWLEYFHKKLIFNNCHIYNPDKKWQR